MQTLTPTATVYVLEEDAFEQVMSENGPEPRLTVTSDNPRVAKALSVLDNGFDLGCEAVGYCDKPVGFYLWEDDDATPRAEVRFAMAVVVDDGTEAYLACEACACPPFFAVSGPDARIPANDGVSLTTGEAAAQDCQAEADEACQAPGRGCSAAFHPLHHAWGNGTTSRIEAYQAPGRGRSPHVNSRDRQGSDLGPDRL